MQMRGNRSLDYKLQIRDMIEQEDQFGVKGYRCQDNMMKEPYFKIPKIAISKNLKAVGFIESEAKKKKWVPPAHYDILTDWTKTKKGQFLKGPKVMFTQNIIQDCKKRGVPAPGAYATNEFFGKRSRPLNPKEGSSEKFCGFIDAASWRG